MIKITKYLSIEDVLNDINNSVEDFQECVPLSASMKGIFEDYPLHKVAIWGDIDAAKILLENGAEINSKGEDDDTPLHRAVGARKVEMIEFLLRSGASYLIKNIYGKTAFDAALNSGSDDIVELFRMHANKPAK